MLFVAWSDLGRVRIGERRARAGRPVREDPGRAGTILWAAIQAIAGIRIALYPYLPHSAVTIGEMLGSGPDIVSWSPPVVPGGTVLGAVKPVFVKLEDDALDE